MDGLNDGAVEVVGHAPAAHHAELDVENFAGVLEVKVIVELSRGVPRSPCVPWELRGQWPGHVLHAKSKRQCS